VIDQEIAERLRTVGQLEAGERDALERRDKVALDVAWRGREGELAKLRVLEERRASVYQALAQRVEPEVAAWGERAARTVAAWREQDQERLAAVERGLREVESLLWNLLNAEGQRALARQELQAELAGLLAAAEPVPVSPPEVDWSVPAPVLRDVLARAESIVDMLRRTQGQLAAAPE
jgi:hypothetical protein